MSVTPKTLNWDQIRLLQTQRYLGQIAERKDHQNGCLGCDTGAARQVDPLPQPVGQAPGKRSISLQAEARSLDKTRRWVLIFLSTVHTFFTHLSSPLLTLIPPSKKKFLEAGNGHMVSTNTISRSVDRKSQKQRKVHTKESPIWKKGTRLKQIVKHLRKER